MLIGAFFGGFMEKVRLRSGVTLFGIMAAVMLLMTVKVKAEPATPPTPAVKPEAFFYATDATTEPGRTVPVEIAIKGNPGIWAVQFKVDYDKSVLTLTDIQSVNSKVFDFNNELTLPIDIEKRDAIFLAASDDYNVDKTADGSIVKLLFKVNSNVGNMNTKVNVKVIQAINANEEEIELKEQGGNIRIYVPSQDSESESEGGSGGTAIIKPQKVLPVVPTDKKKGRKPNKAEFEQETELTPELTPDTDYPIFDGEVVDPEGKTIIPATPQDDLSDKGYFKTVAIVIGIIALAGAGAFIFWILNKRKRRPIE